MPFYLILALTLLTPQQYGLSASLGKTYAMASDNPYQSDLTIAVGGHYVLTDNLEGALVWSHTKLTWRARLGWEASSLDEIHGTLALAKKVSERVDLYLCGGGGVTVTPATETKPSVCCGLGMKIGIVSWLSLRFSAKLQHVFDELSFLRDWGSFSLGLDLDFSGRKELRFRREDELYVIQKYLAPGLEVPEEFESDHEMEEFIEAFWKANDPIPPTPRNEYREKIFSRIEYAAKWFKEIFPGWKTDRGRIWIIFGEPDEVLRKEGSTHPTEQWIYHIQYKDVMPVVFVFEQRDVYRQVASNVPGEFGYDAFWH